MPKLKTKSGVKKRFKLTATGKLKHGVVGKRHRLISHNAKYIRQNRGTRVLSDADTAWDKATGAGAEVRFPMADQFWGDRYGQVKDPFGFTWSIGAPLKQAQKQSAEQPATA